MIILVLKIGETLVGGKHAKGGLIVRVVGVVFGSVLYRFIVAIALRLSVPAEALKLVSAFIVAVAISYPYLKKQFHFRKLEIAKLHQCRECLAIVNIREIVS